MVPDERYVVRLVRAGDAPAIAAIYAPIVASTHISFEYESPGSAEMARRIEKTLAAGFPWLVSENNQRVTGYAYATPHREREGYRWSVETSVYIDAACRGRGLGQRLYGVIVGDSRGARVPERVCRNRASESVQCSRA